MKAKGEGTFGAIETPSFLDDEEELTIPIVDTGMKEAASQASYAKKPGFNEIGGLPDGLKSTFQDLKHILTQPDRYDEKFRSILLYGEPGLGKTMFFEALIKESAKNVFVVTPSDFEEDLKRADSVEAKLRILQRGLRDKCATIAEEDASPRRSSKRNSRRTVIFLANEFDHYFPTGKGGTIATDIWDGLTQRCRNLMVLATTNEEQQINRAIFDRFDKRIEVKRPDRDQTAIILSILFVKMLRDAKAKGNREDIILDKKIYEPLVRFIAQNKAYQEYMKENPRATEDEPDIFLEMRTSAVKGLRDFEEAIADLLPISGISELSQRDMKEIMEGVAESHHIALNRNDDWEAADRITTDVKPISLVELRTLFERRIVDNAKVEAKRRDESERERRHAA